MALTVRDEDLLCACEDNDVRSAARLLRDGADVDAKHPENDWAPVMVAAQFRDCRLLELLLRRAADPSERDKYWETALHIAVTCENARAVDLLLANGANADLQNKRCKWTALHIACSQGHFAIAAALIDHGASTKLVDTKKLCALALMADESKRAELEQRGRRADTWRRRRGLVLCYSSLAAPTQASSARVLSTAAVLGCSDLAACVAKYL